MHKILDRSSMLALLLVLYFSMEARTATAGSVIFCGRRREESELTELRLRMPKECPFCGRLGTVTLETTVRGDAVTLNWCCRECGREWRIQADEQLPDRRSSPERRKSVRKERRST